MTSIPTIEFTGKAAFVSGAGSGIGRATAIAFARAGAAVTIVDIDGVGLSETAADIGGFGGRALARICDVTKSAEVKAALAATVDALGGSTPPSTMQASSSPARPSPTFRKKGSTASSRSI